ncbi:MAG: hypothetical protein ACXWPM_02665 [Bdellovibrionota bacterium]
MRVFLFTAAVTILVSLPGLAQDASQECPAQGSIDTGKIHIQGLQGKKHCTVLVRPLDSGSNYRSFIFSDSGSFVVFTSRKGLGTGGHGYFLFPRGRSRPQVNASASDVSVTASGGHVLHFSNETGEPTSGGEFSFHADPVAASSDGLKIDSYDGLLLDCGWAKEKPGYAARGGKCVLRDSTNATCSVDKDLLFSYPGPAEAEFRYSLDSLGTDKPLWEKLRPPTCKGVDLSSLLVAPPTPIEASERNPGDLGGADGSTGAR